MAMKIASLPSRQNLAKGAKVQGPPHTDGGVQVQDQQGQPVAEVEGDERVFSKEDTQQIEQACQQITKLQQQNPKVADKLAQELGYAVCEMIIKQEQNQKSEESGFGQDQGEQQAAPGAEAANSFATPPGAGY